MATFNDFIEKPSSKKITIIEIDSPVTATWVNYQAGIWYTMLSPNGNRLIDINGDVGYWGTENATYYNIQSLNIQGELYNEVASIAQCISTSKSWYYNQSTTEMYIHFDSFNPPEVYEIIAAGAAIGFSNEIDSTTNNFYEDVYYEPLIQNVPKLSKKKDSLFFGILQYQGGSISFDNTGGYFDDFATRDLYGQPVRILLTFEGLDYSEAQTVYTGRVEDFTHDFTRFKLKVADLRKLLSRSLPVNNLTLTDYPTMDSDLDGTPIPIAFGSIIKAPTYRTSSGNWIFADTEFNSIDSGIVVYDEDGTVFTHGGTETDGTFTGTDTDDSLYVTFTQSSVANGLDIIADILDNYEGIAFDANNYDTVEWTSEKSSVSDEGIWIGKGNILTSVDVIEQVCTDNQGIFDVLADGRYTFRSFNADRIPEYEVFEDELLNDPSIDYDSEEYLSSVKVEYAKNLQNSDYQIYTNSDFQSEVYARYRQYKERIFTTALTSQADAVTLTDDVMEQSKFIYPKITLTTKIQNIGLRILDNVLYEYKRLNGKIILNRSSFQVLGINLNLTSYEMTLEIKQIKEFSREYRILDGGDSSTDHDYYDGGDSTTDYDIVVDGGEA
ncbi:MAG: hypothetical protein JRJ00_00290 [Deltaproteobacteria bacterium]|nr:hypothetical protein [Deltaproteobacteria bacterium]